MTKKIVLLCLFILGVVTGIYGIPKGYPIVASLFPIIFALPLFYFLFRSNPFIKIFLLLTLLSFFALAIETVGVLTGFPYGHFIYTDLFAFKLFETTPLIVPFGWIPIVVGAYILVKKFIFDSATKSFLVFIALILLTDAIIDPGAVKLGMWVYKEGGVYYGVPVSNFLGWILSGTVAFLLLNHFLKTSNRQIIFYFACLLAYWTGIAFGASLIIPSCIGCVFLILLRNKSK